MRQSHLGIVAPKPQASHIKHTKIEGMQQFHYWLVNKARRHDGLMLMGLRDGRGRRDAQLGSSRHH